MIDQGVADALATCDADRNTNGNDSHNSGMGVRRTERVARKCTYPYFMKCQPLNLKGTEGVVELIQWFKKMETVFSIRNCYVENQIKFSTCTLLAGALTWWNSHVRTVGHDVAYAMTWTDLKRKMTDKYCLRVEIKKLEAELWNLKVKESDKIERYVGGLPDMIHKSVVASKPKRMQEAIEIATELMDNKIHTFAKRQTKNKRKQDDNQQQQNKRQNTGWAYTTGSGEKKSYEGSKPLCAKFNYHHDGPCAPKCHKCNRVGHLARDCRSTANVNTAHNQRGTGACQNPTCYECGAHGHFKTDCPKQKNNNRGNQSGNGNAPMKVVYVIISMDWLAKYQVVIVYAEKIVRIPWGNEMLIVRGNESDQGNETRLNIISCTKTQKYMLKGCPIFLAHVTTKETEDKSERKRLEDVPIVRNFPKVFPKDLSGLPLSHPAKAEARGGTSWISLQHNGVYYKDTKRKRK
ncbi:putative reverse transcriptase domain-containing protein [Tanacetum coccineum]